MQERTRHGQSSAGTCRQEARMLPCARLAHARCACCTSCREELRPRSAAAAFIMPPTVSCACSLTPYSASARSAALSHALLLLSAGGPGLAWPAPVCAVPLPCLPHVEACALQARQPVQCLPPRSAATGVPAASTPLAASRALSASVAVRPSAGLPGPADVRRARRDCDAAWRGLDGP